jgi:hypothetical protein
MYYGAHFRFGPASGAIEEPALRDAAADGLAILLETWPLCKDSRIRNRHATVKDFPPQNFSKDVSGETIFVFEIGGSFEFTG